MEDVLPHIVEWNILHLRLRILFLYKQGSLNNKTILKQIQHIKFPAIKILNLR